MIEGVFIGVLTVIVVLNIVYTIALFLYVTKLHKMVNEVFIGISKTFEKVEHELKTKIGLKPGEKISATTLHFKGVDIAKGHTLEPMDSITVLEFSNAPTESRKNE
jgi:hypothetical protein